jgi:uncharacterized protein involved in response to NO
MNSPLIRLQEPRRAAPAPGGWALWQLGFRPFYLLAAGFAALSVPLWALQYAGWLGTGLWRGPAWHAHEMLFGYTLAVVVGFLFTAGRNWSGHPTPTGRSLQALALLWMAGRVMVLTPWPLAALLVNMAFPLAAAAGLAQALVPARNRRNYFFIGLLVALGLAQGAVHAALAGWLQWPAALGLRVALDLVLLIMTVMTGRVLPAFTNNGVPGAGARNHPLLERAALGSVGLLLAADALGASGWAMALLLAAAAIAHAARLALWRPWATRRNPLVWVLHLAWAWVVLHLLLRAGAEAGWLAASPATHALTAGAIATLTLGMMSRTARGHTGRLLHADAADRWACGLVTAGAALRVFLPLLWPASQVEAVLASAMLWSAGMAVFAVHYGPWLCRTRLDGLPG